MPVMQLSSTLMFFGAIDALIACSATLGASGANTSFDYIGKALMALSALRTF